MKSSDIEFAKLHLAINRLAVVAHDLSLYEVSDDLREAARKLSTSRKRKASQKGRNA